MEETLRTLVVIYYPGGLDPDTTKRLLENEMVSIEKLFPDASTPSTDLDAIAENLLRSTKGPKVLWLVGRGTNGIIEEGVKVFANGVEKID